MTEEIISKILDLDGKPFEVFMSGDQRSDKLALFLHGFTESAYSWRHQMKLLGEMGYKCWAPNQRGYGNSFMPPKVADYHINHLMDDVAELIDAEKCKSVTLIAHDWGAIVAWQFAIQKIRPLDRLVILNVPHPFVIGKELKKWRQLKKLRYVFFFLIPMIPEYIWTKNNGKSFVRLFRSALFRKEKLIPEELEMYRINALRPHGMTSMMNWYRAYVRNSREISQALNEYKNEKIQVPTLMIWGEEDVALDIHTTLGTEKYIEEFTLRYIHDAGHFVHEEAAEEVNTILKAWLEGKEVPGDAMPSTL